MLLDRLVTIRGASRKNSSLRYINISLYNQYYKNIDATQEPNKSIQNNNLLSIKKEKIMKRSMKNILLESLALLAMYTTNKYSKSTYYCLRS